MAVARAQHDAVFAECHRVGIAIFCLVMDRQQGHRRGNHRDFDPAVLAGNRGDLDVGEGELQRGGLDDMRAGERGEDER